MNSIMLSFHLFWMLKTILMTIKAVLKLVGHYGTGLSHIAPPKNPEFLWWGNLGQLVFS